MKRKKYLKIYYFIISNIKCVSFSFSLNRGCYLAHIFTLTYVISSFYLKTHIHHMHIHISEKIFLLQETCSITIQKLQAYVKIEKVSKMTEY
jgi:hypothetical protein